MWCKCQLSLKQKAGLISKDAHHIWDLIIDDNPDLFNGVVTYELGKHFQMFKKIYPKEIAISISKVLYSSSNRNTYILIISIFQILEVFWKQYDLQTVYNTDELL